MQDSGIYSIFEELRTDNSATFKQNTLKKYVDDDMLKTVLEYTYTPFRQYYIKQIPEYNPLQLGDTISYDLASALSFVDRLSIREITGNNARDELTKVLEQLHPNDAKVLVHILDRSIDCGISAKTINKVWKKLIGEIPYMRCEKLTEKTKKNMKYPAIVQLKADGIFLNIVKHNNEVYCLTRNGSKFWINKVTEFFEMKIDDDNFVINGEAVVYKNGKPLSRKVSNGLVNSYIKREDTRQSILDKQKGLVAKGKGGTKAFTNLANKLHENEEEWRETEQNLVIEAWDLINYNDWANGKSDVPYDERLSKFKEFVKECDFVHPIITKYVDSYEEAQQFANDMMSNGLEGGVLKNLDGIWENKTSKNQIKLKAELDADLIVVGYTPGTGDFEGGIGSIICRTKDDLLEVNVGSGFKRSDRGLQRVDENDMSKGLMLREDINDIDTFFNETYNGKIVVIKYNEVIKSEGKDKYSLFLPIFEEIRHDKDEADTLERLLK